MTEDFDYGERKEDGQYENHPTIDEGEFQQPVKMVYIHETCNGATNMSRKIAESIARDPEYYTKTFCYQCGDYYPVEQFRWESGEDWVIQND